MPKGRPTKMNISSEEEAIKILNTETYFKNEKHLCNFLEDNIEQFALDNFGSPLKYYKREWALGANTYFHGVNPRVDFMLELQDGRVIMVECKCPKNAAYSSVAMTIAQLLSYSVSAKRNGKHVDKLVYLTTKYNPIIIEVIQEFNLPIDLVLLSKEYRFVWYYNGNFKTT